MASFFRQSVLCWLLYFHWRHQHYHRSGLFQSSLMLQNHWYRLCHWQQFLFWPWLLIQLPAFYRWVLCLCRGFWYAQFEIVQPGPGHHSPRLHLPLPCLCLYPCLYLCPLSLSFLPLIFFNGLFADFFFAIRW